MYIYIYSSLFLTCITANMYRLGQMFLHIFRGSNEYVIWFRNFPWFVMGFNNHSKAYILKMTGIWRSAMHQWTLSWCHVWPVKKSALTTTGQVLNSLLFCGLLYLGTGNVKDEPIFCNMMFDMDLRDLIAILHAFLLNALITGVQMFGKRVIAGWHTCYKTKGQCQQKGLID